MKKLFTVKSNSLNHRVKFTGFRQSAVLSGSGFIPRQYCIGKPYPIGPLNVEPLLLTKMGVLCLTTLCHPTS